MFGFDGTGLGFRVVLVIHNWPSPRTQTARIRVYNRMRDSNSDMSGIELLLACAGTAIDL